MITIAILLFLIQLTQFFNHDWVTDLLIYQIVLDNCALILKKVK